MADTNDDLLNSGDSDSGDDSGNTGGAGVTLEALQAEIAALRTRDDQRTRDFATAVGRWQALETKVTEGRGSADAAKQLAIQQEATSEALRALIDDETVSDAVKARARAAFAKADTAQASARESQLQSRVDALEAALRNGGQSAGSQSSGVSTFEAGVISAIEAAGLDPDDALFDWKGEASTLLRTQGEAAARAYFQKQIRTALQADSRRQSRRTDASTAVSGGSAGAGTKPLDASRPIEDRLKHLQALGVI